MSSQTVVEPQQAAPDTTADSWPRQIGPLRWMVAILALVAAPCAYLQDVSMGSPWDLLIKTVMPGVALFLIWAIPLDILMAKVFKSEADAATQARYRRVIRFDLMVMLVMLLSWGYFFLQIMLQRLT
ncbi:MAG: hypothetical protein R3F53_12070 [Gammaproteobacteria bacterium]